MRILAGRWASVIALLAVVVLTVCAVVLINDTRTKHGVADFETFTGVYENDKIRILGVEVGTIDKVTPTDDGVRVEFSYDGDYQLPADVHAVVVAPTLVATRFVQLEPAYSGGEVLADGASIPKERTASPLEFDDLKSELSRLSTSLGPNQFDDSGALADFLEVAASNSKGQGKRFNTMIREFSAAMETLASGKGDLFGALRNLQVFVSAMASVDKGVEQFNRNLAGAGDLLDDNSKELTKAIRSVDRAALLVGDFTKRSAGDLKTAVNELTKVTTLLANSRDDLATLLHVAPNTLTNFFHILSPRLRSTTGGLMLDNLTTPGQLLCTLVAQAAGNAGNGLDACARYLSPLLSKLGIDVPVGTSGPLEMPGGGGPLEPEPDEHVPFPSDAGSELPPSTENLDLLELLTGGRS